MEATAKGQIRFEPDGRVIPGCSIHLASAKGDPHECLEKKIQNIPICVCFFRRDSRNYNILCYVDGVIWFRLPLKKFISKKKFWSCRARARKNLKKTKKKQKRTPQIK